MTYRSILLLALCLLVAGCASTAQLAQRDSERCAARGFQPNSDDFKNCLVQLETERQVRLDARNREMAERSASPFSR
jgi:hypothetical protein